jgi:hypothetical protein
MFGLAFINNFVTESDSVGGSLVMRETCRCPSLSARLQKSNFSFFHSLGAAIELEPLR